MKIKKTVTAPRKMVAMEDKALEFIYEPGNGTRFEVVFAWLEGGRLLVALPNFRSSYTFTFAAHPGYIEEKLRLLPGDAIAMANLINARFEKEGGQS